MGRELQTEVTQVRATWGEEVVALEHLREGAARLASRVGTSWWLAGRRVGFLPEGTERWLAPLLAVSPPVLSEVRTEPLGILLVPGAALDGDPAREVFHHGSDVTRVTVPLRWDPTLWRDGTPCRADVLVAQGLALREGDELVVTVGGADVLTLAIDGLEVDVRRVRATRLVAGPDLAADDRATRVALAVAGALAVAIALVVESLPRPGVIAASVVDDLLDEVVVRRRVVPPPPTPRAPSTERGTGPRTPGAPSATATAAPSGAADRDARTGLGAGLQEALAGLDAMGSALDGLGAALDRLALPGQAGAALGVARLGPRGGFGNGDVAGGGGGVGRVGPGGPGGDPFGGGRLGDGKPPGEVRTPVQDAQAIGSLSRAEVDRVIQRHLVQIRYCYQTRMQRDPSLAGTVAMRFVIAGDGSVSRADTARDTTGDPQIGACIARRIQGMRFPEPRGAGIVHVKYPFVFAPTM